MKQSEKLDLVLRELYKYYQKEGYTGYYSISEILSELNIPFGIDEAFRLGKRLENERLVNVIGGLGGGMSAELNSYGIEYCEEDSFSVRGSSLITNQYSINISNSTGTNVVQSSTNVSINQNNKDELLPILEKIYMAIQVSSELNEELQNEAIGRLNEIKEYVEKVNKLPVYSLNDLLSVVGNVASIASLILTIK